ncbi:NAD(P)-binding protein [Epithele typhae]|uniref:NAD(P)-binding protein n=1 Tax=Epithele typhae TaxID=378194 RepID=UPI00200820AA|nr:NAD(P)-binding protein [Epithele typhae]KAH9932702.1 NAD(P)-binding protein [Epithele typhae]
MPSYAIIGASRGIGLEFAIQLGKVAGNTVFAVVRNPDTAKKLEPVVSAHPNVHMIKGDMESAASLQSAVADVSKITGGKLDYLIVNGARLLTANFQFTIDKYAKLIAFVSPDAQTLETDLMDGFRINAVGAAHSANAFLPLLRKGGPKKILFVASTAGDMDFAVANDFANNCQYTASKSAMNMIAAQFAIALKSEGFVVLAINPGMVNTMAEDPNDFQTVLNMVPDMVKKFKENYPEWNGLPITPTKSVSMVLDVLHKAGPESSGKLLSHHGDKAWFDSD